MQWRYSAPSSVAFLAVYTNTYIYSTRGIFQRFLETPCFIRSRLQDSGTGTEAGGKILPYSPSRSIWRPHRYLPATACRHERRGQAHAIATTIQARWLPPRRRGRRRGSRTEEGSAPGGCAQRPILHGDSSCLASRGDIADGNLFWYPHVGMPRVPAPFQTAREAPCTTRQGDH